ncbi:MAG: hypothetical protein LBM56_02990 [Burkholderiaceae bacterium]|jgi:signal transduction histidine kinase|nr:hypothetical protein [Burkholderiaceae bacterium]
MKRLFSLQHQVILVLMAFMGLSFLLTGYLVRDISQSMILREKQEKLLTIAHILDARLPPEGFDGILLRYHAENATREDKIRILNRVLRQDTDNIGESAPGLGVGFYSRDLDAIVTYGPSISFGSTVGTSVAADHPGRQVMETSTQIVKSGSMVRGDILNAMIPIQRGGKTIGYIWANELTTDISAQLGNMTRNIFLVTLLSSSLIFILLILLARRTLNDIDRIITGTRNIRNDLSQRIEVRKGDLGEIADNINGMAESVGKAVDKANNAIAVLQNVMSNVDAMICVCDPQTKKVVYINDWLCRRLGRNDLEGKTCYEVLHGHTEPCSFCPHKYLFDEDGHPVDEILNRTIHNQLINCNLMVTDKLVKWYDGRVLHMEIGTDATERNAKAISEAVNQAQQSFLARFNHEIRPPMDNILGVTHTALEAFPSPEQAAYLQKIQSSARGLLEVINDIMDYQRIEANEIIIEKQAFNVRKAIESVKKAIMPRAEAKYLEFQVTVDNSIPE